MTESNPAFRSGNTDHELVLNRIWYRGLKANSARRTSVAFYDIS